MISPNTFWENPFETQKVLLDGLGLDEADITIFDVGANIGQTARTYRALFPIATIYSFEPFLDSVRTLQATFEADRKIRIVSKAVADKQGRRAFYVNEYDATNSLFPRPQLERRYYPKAAGHKDTIEVDAITLDEFVTSEKIDTVAVLKMDIQGGELAALKGATSLLNEKKISLIYTECMFVHHYEKSPLFFEVWGYLDNLGYTLFSIHNVYGASNGQIRQGDALFVSPQVRENVINKYPDER